MKRLLTLALVAVFIMSALVSAYANETIAIKSQDEIKVVVFKIGDKNYYLEDKDGNIQTVQMDVAPYIKDGRTLVPARYLGNALGVPDENIIWDQATKTAVFKGKKELTLTIGSKTMKSDNAVIQMDATPEIIPPGRTMMLARYVAEGLGYEVGWDAVRKLVICWEEGTPQPDLTKITKEIEDNQPKEIEDEQPVVPKPGQKVLSSAELKKIYKIFESKGYKVGLRGVSEGYINDYWSINIYSAKSDPNKDQFDADVYEQAKAFMGIEAAEWVKKTLDFCERPDCYTSNVAKRIGDKAIAVYMTDAVYDPDTDRMKSSDIIIVEFTDHRALRSLR